MSGFVRGLAIGAIAGPVALIALGFVVTNFWTLLAIAGAIIAFAVAAAVLYALTAPKPPPPEAPTFDRRARGAPLEPEG